MVDVGVLNTEEEQVLANVKHNITQGWTQVQPYETNDSEVMILGGGPSLALFEDKIRELQGAGVKIITLNGAYNWCMERGIGPLNQVIVDARPFNARFVQPVSEENRYFIASQCDPSVFEGAEPSENMITEMACEMALNSGSYTDDDVAREKIKAREWWKQTNKLPKERTLIWHTSADFIREALDEQYGTEPWYGILGGSTVLLRAIPLFRMMGFAKFHIIGCDSCIMNGKHHAYEQPENPGSDALPVICGNKTFYCSPWMFAQCQELISLIKALGSELELEIYGDGLLAHVINYGAELALEAENPQFQIKIGSIVEAKQHVDTADYLIGYLDAENPPVVSTNGIPSLFLRVDDIHPSQEKQGMVLFNHNHIHNILKFVEDNQIGQDAKTLLIHCTAGISRSTATALGILVYLGYSYEDAFNTVEKVRPWLHPNKWIIKCFDNALGKNGEFYDYYGIRQKTFCMYHKKSITGSKKMKNIAELVIDANELNPLTEMNNCDLFGIGKLITPKGKVYYSFSNDRMADDPLLLTEKSFAKLIEQLQKYQTDTPEDAEEYFDDEIEE